MSTAMLRVVGVLVTAVAILLGTGTLVAQFFARTAVDTRSLGTGISRLVTDVRTGDVAVRVGPPGSAVQVTTTRHWSFRPPTTSATVSGGTARLTGSCDETVSLAQCAVDLVVVVPAGTDLDLTVSTGDVTVDGADGSLRVAAATGDVTGTGLRSADVRATLTTGNVRLTFVAAPTAVSAQSVTGDVTVSVPPGDSYRLDGSATVGSRTITVPTDPTSSRSIDARTSVGDVRVATR